MTQPLFFSKLRISDYSECSDYSEPSSNLKLERSSLLAPPSSNNMTFLTPHSSLLTPLSSFLSPLSSLLFNYSVMSGDIYGFLYHIPNPFVYLCLKHVCDEGH